VARFSQPTVQAGEGDPVAFRKLAACEPTAFESLGHATALAGTKVTTLADPSLNFHAGRIAWHHARR